MHYIQVEEAAAHIRDEFQKPAKNYIRKIREIEWSATIWQVLNEKCIKTGNGNDVNQLKIAL